MKEYEYCSLEDLNFYHSDEDNKVVKAYKNKHLPILILSKIIIALMLAFIAASWIFISRTDLLGNSLLSAYLLIAILLITIFTKKYRFKPVGTIRGKVVSKHFGQHCDSNGDYDITYYVTIGFDSVHKLISGVNIPEIKNQSPEIGTDIIIMKNKNNKYGFIYPDFL